jgi:uncharacterized protein YceK
MKKIAVLLLVMTLALAGCVGVQSYTPLQKAEVGAYVAHATYLDIYKQCLAYTPVTAQDKKIYNEVIRPKVNDLKVKLVLYIDAVDIWKQGKSDGATVADKKAAVDALIEDIFLFGIIKTTRTP